MQIIKTFASFLGTDLWKLLFNRIHEGHGLLITFIGLTAVFVGLTILWLITASFRKFVNIFEEKSVTGNGCKKRKKSAEVSKKEEELQKIALAISVALCYEMEEEEFSILTLRNIEQEMSPWVVASRPTTMRHS